MPVQLQEFTPILIFEHVSLPDLHEQYTVSELFTRAYLETGDS